MKFTQMKIVKEYLSWFITQYQALQQSTQHPHIYKIFSKKFCKKQIFMIEQADKANLITASVQSISNDPAMIGNFSSRDAHLIGFAAGMKSIIVEEKNFSLKELI